MNSHSSLLSDHCSFPCVAAPSDYPQNVAVSTVSSTEIRVTWEPVPEIDQNGIVIQYEVEYTPLMTFGGLISESTTFVDVSITEITLTDLQEFVEYNTSVRAYTSVGPGPFSPPETNRTDEAGKLVVIFAA